MEPFQEAHRALPKGTLLALAYCFLQQWHDCCQLPFACSARQVFPLLALIYCNGTVQWSRRGLAQTNANGTAAISLYAVFLFISSERFRGYLFIYKQKGKLPVSGKEGVGFA